MTMRPAAVVSLVKETLAPMAAKDVERCNRVDEWMSADRNRLLLSPDVPARDKRRTAKVLERLAGTPLLRLIVEETAQQLVVDGVTSDSGRTTSAMWGVYERNGLPSKQAALYRAALTYGDAFALALPGTSPTVDGVAAEISTFSPRTMHVVYGDQAEDEWPLYALRVIKQASGRLFRFYDENDVHFLGEEDGRIEYIEARPHGLGVCPIVRFAPNADIDGVSQGEPERFHIVAERHEKTTHDRLLAQHHNSWKVRTATGLEEPGTPQERDEQKSILEHGDILTGGVGVQFGTLPETPLDGLLKAESADLETLAAIAQKPSWSLAGGQLVNLSADAIAEARASERLKNQMLQRTMGRPHAQLLRLGSFIEGRQEDASDFGLHVNWVDMESRSLSQSADALGKIATQLGAPAEMLWELIPGVSKATVERWRMWAADHPSVDAALAAHLVAQDAVSG